MCWSIVLGDRGLSHQLSVIFAPLGALVVSLWPSLTPLSSTNVTVDMCLCLVCVKMLNAATKCPHESTRWRLFCRCIVPCGHNLERQAVWVLSTTEGLWARTQAPSGLHLVHTVINLSGFAESNPTEPAICLRYSEMAYGIFRAADAPGLLCSQATSFGF